MTDKKEILNRVMALMGWDRKKALLWYKTPNFNFGGCAPSVLDACGRGHKVLKFIAAAEENLVCDK